MRTQRSGIGEDDISAEMRGDLGAARNKGQIKWILFYVFVACKNSYIFFCSFGRIAAFFAAHQIFRDDADDYDVDDDRKNPECAVSYSTRHFAVCSRSTQSTDKMNNLNIIQRMAGRRSKKTVLLFSFQLRSLSLSLFCVLNCAPHSILSSISLSRDLKHFPSAPRSELFIIFRRSPFASQPLIPFLPLSVCVFFRETFSSRFLFFCTEVSYSAFSLPCLAANNFSVSASSRAHKRKYILAFSSQFCSLIFQFQRQ